VKEDFPKEDINVNPARENSPKAICGFLALLHSVYMNVVYSSGTATDFHRDYPQKTIKNHQIIQFPILVDWIIS